MKGKTGRGLTVLAPRLQFWPKKSVMLRILSKAACDESATDPSKRMKCQSLRELYDAGESWFEVDPSFS
ncbi:hypothetical protein Tsubulata_009765, partial [Turnera subulata]